MEHDAEKFSLLKTFLIAAGIEVVKVELPKFEVDGVEKTVSTMRVESEDFLKEVWHELKKHNVTTVYILAIYMVDYNNFETKTVKTREVIRWAW